MQTNSARDGAENVLQKIFSALDKRASALSGAYADGSTTALRLFHGFSEGDADLALDLYGRTLVILSFRKKPEADNPLFPKIAYALRESLPFIQCALLKERFSADPERQKGTLLFGAQPDRSVREWGVSYAIDLRLNRDCSFYLDSAGLRQWLLAHAAGKSVLNTFAYTGSLGMAALASGASFVTQTDLKRNFLALFEQSASLNRVDSAQYELLPGDFFRVISAMRRQNRLFDFVILDPPFFSKTSGGQVDQQQNTIALVNKIRPLVAHQGKIILVNNALYLSGQDYLHQLETLCEGAYLSLGERIPVPESFFGGTIGANDLPADPAPFNHSTKIITIDVSRKGGRTVEAAQ